MKLFLLLVLLAGCSSSSTEPFPEQASRPFQTGGHEQFFLAELPHWANGSVRGNCARSLSVRYLDFSALERVHGLNFKQSLELQAQFNLKWRRRFVGQKLLSLTPQEEASMFLETLAQVKAGLQEFRFPASPKINLVWWESIVNMPKLKNSWMNVLNQGHPVVLVSVCDDSDTIESWLEKEKLDGAGFFVFGAEVLTPARPDKTPGFGLMSPLDAYFDKKMTTLWKGGLSYPAEFPLDYPVKTLEE